MKGVIYLTTDCPKCGHEEFTIQDFLSSIGLGLRTNKKQIEFLAELKYAIITGRSSRQRMKCRRCHSILKLSKPDWMKTRKERVAIQ